MLFKTAAVKSNDVVIDCSRHVESIHQLKLLARRASVEPGRERQAIVQAVIHRVDNRGGRFLLPDAQHGG